MPGEGWTRPRSKAYMHLYGSTLRLNESIELNMIVCVIAFTVFFGIR